MHSISEVFALIDSSVVPRVPLKMALNDALGRVLHKSFRADADQPEYDRSAIDGFAVLAGAVPGVFRLAGEILPGDPALSPPKENEALRIFTGAAVPAGCGLVMIEDSVAGSNEDEVVLRKAPDASLIRRRGSSLKAGTELIPAGTEIRPGEIALLASAGEPCPLVYPVPRVLHLVTGREIVEPATQPGPGQIRDSNGPMIRALLAEIGIPVGAQIRVDESVETLRAAVEDFGAFDLLLVSGGSSVGKYDRTRAGLESLGFSLLLERVNSRPGKPTILARRGDQWAFGLPGNPVAHFVVFQVFVKRVLRAMANQRPIDRVRARLSAATPASSDPRETFWPAWVHQAGAALEVTPRRWVDSGDLAALVDVNALIHFPETTRAAAGDMVSVLPCIPFPCAETSLDPLGKSVLS